MHKSIKYGVWASTDHGNKRLDQAYRESGNKGPIYLFFSVNTSGQFSVIPRRNSAPALRHFYPGRALLLTSDF